MNTPLRPIALLLSVVFLAAVSVVSPARLSSGTAMQDAPAEGRKKKPPPGAVGFEQFAGRDAADKLIKGAATRRMPPPSPPAGIVRPVRRPPNPVNVAVTEAERQQAAGNFEAAVAAYKQAIELNKTRPAFDDGELQFALGKVYREMERYEEAAAEFRYAAARPATNDLKVYATFELGNAYLDLGKYADASAAYDETLKLLSGEWKEAKPALSVQYLPYPHFNRGLAALGLKQPEQAAAAFEEAVRLKPDFAAARFNLGLTLWQLGRQDAAREAQQQLKELDAALAERLAALFK